MQTITTASGVVLAVTTRAGDDLVEILVERKSGPPCVLHWGLLRGEATAWQVPPELALPPGSRGDQHAVSTPLAAPTDTLALRLHPAWGFRFLVLALFDPKTSRWDSNQGKNYRIVLPTPSAPGSPAAWPPSDLVPGDVRLGEIAARIIEPETGPGSWTLMHRFNLAWDLLDQIPGDSAPGLALLFVWLRFSAIRQLDWQRNYNTQPRDLAHAQDRLTLKLAERAARETGQRPLLRMLAGTLGRGGDGQRVRDAILEIMHRHHVKEVAGHFLEEWHQKLHNNTTPDDVLICEAYLEFLCHHGDAAVFYRVLEAGGVTRQRLESYERPIRGAPDFVPALRDAFLHDFGDLLGILRSVHSATDFGAALKAARGCLDQPTRELLDAVWGRHADPQAATWLLDTITRARETLLGELRPGRAGLRDLLYLDLGLEELLRTVVERHLHEPRGIDDLLTWTELLLQNLLVSRPSEDLALCLGHLRRLIPSPHADRTWALHLQAVTERLRRELMTTADRDYRLLQPIAEYLGAAFAAPPWTVRMFSEEVLRGRLDFVVSALLRKLDEAARGIAQAGDWQWSSRGSGHATGVLRKVDSLAELAPGPPEASTILVVARMSGTEEIPEGVVAVFTEQAVDLMSHLAVRARNAGVLLATCGSPERLAKLGAAHGQWLRLAVAASGELTAETVEPPATERVAKAAAPVRLVVPPRPGGAFVIGEAAFTEANVGAKSLNLKRLRGRLPEWINLPKGIALPYGVCERVLADPSNREPARRHQALTAQLHQGGVAPAGGLLAQLRELCAGLAAPEGCEAALRDAMQSAGLLCPAAFADAWTCITRVWASKWNDRAFHSRRAGGIPDDSLLMAVLIQEVVPADYAFVIHTANPLTGNRDELAAEIVLGLGETLVGNHPGRALGVVWNKRGRTGEVSSFPSKSVGLYGRGLMFRSDSNGEDLRGLASAGLHDSVMLPAPRGVALDYVQEDLLWDEAARRRFVDRLGDLGVMVEAVLGSPQDIEGVCAGERFFVVQARPQVGLHHG